MPPSPVQPVQLPPRPPPPAPPGGHQEKALGSPAGLQAPGAALGPCAVIGAPDERGRTFPSLRLPDFNPGECFCFPNEKQTLFSTAVSLELVEVLCLQLLFSPPRAATCEAGEACGQLRLLVKNRPAPRRRRLSVAPGWCGREAPLDTSWVRYRRLRMSHTEWCRCETGWV